MDTLLSSSVGSRACCRCGKALDDAASKEAGIGPVCRKLDNALLARLIPARVADAQMLAASVRTDDLPAPTHATFANVMADLLDFGSKDWRLTVKRIEWILSWSMPSLTHTTLVDVVRSLGYVGLAALLSGEAATGKTTVTFENGRLYLFGPRNKTGAVEFKKIKGRMFHPAGVPTANGLKKAWSVPAARADEFYTVVMTYWPNVTGLEEAVAAAKSAPATEAAPAPAPTYLTEAGGVLKVKTPYNAAFVADLKALPYKARKWNGAEKVWEVATEFKAKVEALIATHYNAAAAAA